MKKLNIGKFLKPGKDIIIELDDEVEYLLNDKAVEAIQRGDRKTVLTRLYDQETYFIDTQRIRDTLLRRGVIDYLDKKK